MNTQNTIDPFADELNTAPTPANPLAPTTEDEMEGRDVWADHYAVEAGNWQGDCRDWQ